MADLDLDNLDLDNLVRDLASMQGAAMAHMRVWDSALVTLKVQKIRADGGNPTPEEVTAWSNTNLDFKAKFFAKWVDLETLLRTYDLVRQVQQLQAELAWERSRPERDASERERQRKDMQQRQFWEDQLARIERSQQERAEEAARRGAWVAQRTKERIELRKLIHASNNPDASAWEPDPSEIWSIEREIAPGDYYREVTQGQPSTFTPMVTWYQQSARDQKARRAKERAARELKTRQQAEARRDEWVGKRAAQLLDANANADAASDTTQQALEAAWQAAELEYDRQHVA